MIEADAHDLAVEMRDILVPGVVENHHPHLRLLVATTTAHLNFTGGPGRDPPQGAAATTTDGPRDGSGRGGEITLMTDRDATIECTIVGATIDDSPGSCIAATTPKKLRSINKSPGASKSPDAARRQR